MNEYVFAAEGVGRSYGRRTVLSNASIWGRARTISALFGRNGCGKSTLLRIAAGRQRADHGVVHFLGESYLHPRHDVLARRGLYYLPDEGALPLTLTLAAAAGWLGHVWQVSAAGQDAAFDAVGMRAFRAAYPHELSGGERRLAGLALALMRAPLALLADEPFAGLSPQQAESATSALRALAKGGCAVVVSGHEVPALVGLADDVVWMTAGTTHALGNARAALRHEQFRREYLGTWAHRLA